MLVYKYKWGLYSQESTFSSVNSTDIRDLKINLPPLNQQQKIVKVLELWDSYLEVLEKKIGIKKITKKSIIMSSIYNSKGQKVFVKDIFDLGRGRVISKKEINLNSGSYPVYSSQTSNNGILGLIDTFDFEGDYITWTTDGANAGRVFHRVGKFNCTNVCGIAKLKVGRNDSLRFIKEYLNLVSSRYVSYVGNPKLMNNVFASISIKLPSPEQQSKIAKTLTLVDNEIEALKQKKKLIKQQRKFLLNNLVTGKIVLK